MESEIEISRQMPSDIEEIMNVYYQAWLVTYPNEDLGITVDDIEARFAERLSAEGMQKRRGYVESMLNAENELGLVAKSNGMVVGVLDVIREDSGNTLRSIYVLPEYHGKGIGSKLWGEASQFLDKYKDTLVEVADYNKNAIAFYKKLGFEDTGKRFQNEKLRMKSGAIITEMEMKRQADLG